MRHNECGTQQFGNRAILRQRGEQDVDELHDSDDVLAVGCQHWVAGVTGAHDSPDVADCVGLAHGVGLRPRDHRVFDVAAGEVDDAVDHHRQLRGQVAALTGIGDDVLEVAIRCGVLDIVDGRDPNEAQQEVGRLVKHPDQPTEQRQVDRGRAGQTDRYDIGPGDGQVLGEQFAEHHLNHGREQQRDDRSEGESELQCEAYVVQDRSERLADEGFSNVADEEPRDRDA